MAVNVDGSVRSALLASSGVTALVAQRVYALRAPAGIAYPYVTFFAVAEQLTNDTPREAIDHRYQVDSWSDNQNEALNVHMAVFNALHHTTLTVEGWSNYWTVVTDGQRMVESLDGKNYWHFLWNVRIRASEE